MTPPRPESDRPLRYNAADVTPILTGPDAERVAEFARALNDMILPAVRDEMGRSLRAHNDAQSAKVAESSAALVKLIPRRWRWLAVAGTLFGVGGTTGGVTAWSALDSYKATVAAEAVERKTALDLADATKAHLAVAHVDPNAAADLAIKLAALQASLDTIDARLGRLEQRRGR